MQHFWRNQAIRYRFRQTSDLPQASAAANESTRPFAAIVAQVIPALMKRRLSLPQHSIDCGLGITPPSGMSEFPDRRRLNINDT